MMILGTRRIGLIGLLLVSVTALYLALPMPGRSASKQEISSTRAKIEQKRQKESVLTTDIQRYSSKIKGLQGKIGGLQRRQSVLQSDLDRKQARAESIGKRLDITRRRLARAKRKLAHGRKVLAERLVGIYRTGRPDILSVVLNSNGFADLVERADYLKRIADQDHEVISTVIALKQKTHKQTVILAGLEDEAQQLVAQVRTRRDQVASAKGQLVSRRSELSGAVGDRKAVLANVRTSRGRLERHLDGLVADNQQVTNFLGNQPAGPIRKGTGRFIWPINGSFTSPFGYRWGRLHAGIDIADPTGTPIRAADSGTVRSAGWMGGYGNYTCIQHGSSISTCYGHQSSIGVHVGQNVTQGQVIGAVGNTGHSFGSHLHFEVRINGSPVDPMGYL